MRQRELTASESAILRVAMRRLRRRRRLLPACPAWFVIDSALATVPFLRDAGRGVDALALALAVVQIESGRGDQLLRAAKDVVRENVRADASKKEQFQQDVKRCLDVAGVKAPLDFNPSAN